MTCSAKNMGQNIHTKAPKVKRFNAKYNIPAPKYHPKTTRLTIANPPPLNRSIGINQPLDQNKSPCKPSHNLIE
jgi:hypothetical protein